MNAESQQILDFSAARAARDDGMARSLASAERLSNGWGDIAYAYLLIFARHNETFISEDVSDASKASKTFPQPPTDRAWGSVYRRAVREGVIAQDGSGRSRRRHASICPRWRSLIYVGAMA